MLPEKRKALEAAGWRFGDAADFLAMTEEDRQMLDLRVDAALGGKMTRSMPGRPMRRPSIIRPMFLALSRTFFGRKLPNRPEHETQANTGDCPC